MAINHVQIPYPDFKLHDIIDPEEFDLNNAELQDKINAIIDVLNQITDSIADGSSGADSISLTPISPFISTKLQSFLEEVISRLQSTQDGSSGADFIASTSIPGVTGSTVQAQLESLKSILDSVQTQTNSNTTNISNLQTQITNHKNAPILDHPDGSVTTAKLANNSVTTSKIANGAVTADKVHSSLLDIISLSIHHNKSILDAIEAAYTIAEKNKLAGLPEIRHGLEANRPVATGSGMVYFATDTKKIWKDTASGIWTQMGGQETIDWSIIKDGVKIAISATTPPSPNPGDFWLEDLGESIDFASGDGLLIGNASTDGSNDVWFDENI